MVGSSAPAWGRRVGLALVLLLPINGFIQHVSRPFGAGNLVYQGIMILWSM